MNLVEQLKNWTEEEIEEPNYVETGFPTFDYYVGGFPQGITEITDSDSVGKSVFVLQSIAYNTNLERPCLYIDTENRFSIEVMKRLGVNLDYLIVAHPHGGTDAINIFNSLKNDIKLAVFDSAAALNEEEGTFSRFLRVGLKEFIGLPVVLVNQLRRGRKSYSAGGRTIRDWASLRISLRAGGNIFNLGEVVGKTVELTAIKRQLPLSPIELKLSLYYQSGYCIETDILRLAYDKGLVDIKGSHFYFEEVYLGQGITDARDSLKNDKELRGYILERINEL